MPIITGNQGPFPAGAPGAYGGNASYQVLLHKASPASMVKLAESTIQVTPEDSFVKQSPETPPVLSKPGLDDYFRYADQDLAQLDTDHDGHLNEQELRPVFQDKPATQDAPAVTAAEQAHKMFQAVKQNKDPGDPQPGKRALTLLT